MMCEGCVATVTQALQSVPGVQEVKVSLEDKNAIVKGEVQIDSLIQAVKQAGYTATQ
jgi:copper chaperone CopZ